MDNNLPFVTLNLDKPRKFRLTINGILELKTSHGIDLTKPEEEGFAEKVGDLAFIRALVWIGLRTYESELKEEEVGEMLDTFNMLDIMRQLGFADSGKNALGAATPPQKKKSPNGTGTSPSRPRSESGSRRKSTTP